MPSEDAARLELLRSRRDHARWNVVVGVGLLFIAGSLANLGGLATAALVGAVLTTLYGLVTWGYWGWRVHRADDPWAYDPDLDGGAGIVHGTASPSQSNDPAEHGPDDEPGPTSSLKP